MGIAVVWKRKREKNPKEGEIKVDNEIKTIDENDKVNLKSTPLQTNNYTIKFIDLYQNKEDNETTKKKQKRKKLTHIYQTKINYLFQSQKESTKV